jgi:dsRNA-specific ribonuclease
MVRKDKVEKLQTILNYHFQDESLLIQALTTPQQAHENHTEDYEILETIGDAVIKLIFLKKKYKEGISSPGEITRIKQHLENNKMLKKIGRNYFNLDKYVIKSDAQKIKGTKILADILEALCGAIYLDSNENIKIVEERIINQFYDDWDVIVQESPILNKNKLLEFLQSKLRFTPTIEAKFESSGPDNQLTWIAKNPKIIGNNNQILKNLTQYIRGLRSVSSKTKKEAELNLYFKILSILKKKI